MRQTLALSLALLGAAGCERTTSLALTVTGLREAPVNQARALLVTYRVNGAEAASETFPRDGLTLEEDRDTVRLGLLLRKEVRGDVEVTVQALPPKDEDALVLGKGAQRGALSDTRLDLQIPLKPQRLCSESGWCWELPMPSARPMRALWGSGPDDLWAAGEFGTLLHYDGQYWSVEDLPEEAGEADLYALWGSGRDDVWAVGGSLPSVPSPSTAARSPGVVLHRDETGWRVVKKDPDWIVVAGVFGVKPGEVWVSGTRRLPGSTPSSDGFLLRCTANPLVCDSETRMLDLLPAYQGVEPRGIWGNGADGTLWAVANWTGTMDQKGFLLSKGAGEVSWKVVFQGGVSNAFFRRIFGVDNLLWVGSRRTDRDPLGTYGDATTSFTLPVTAGDGNQGILPLFDDGVTLYGMLPAALREGGLGSQLRNSRSVPLVVEGALPARSVPSDAASLPWAPPAIRANLAALWGVKGTGGDLWAAGSEGFITHRAEGRWNARGKLPLAQAPLIYGFWAGRSDDAYAVGEGGQIFHFTDGRWAEESPGDAPRLLGVWGLPGGDVFAVGLGGTILRRQAGTWRKETTPAQQDLFSVWGSGPGDVFAVGSGGVILRWDGDAGGWQVDRSGEDTKLYSVWGVEGDSARWAVGCTGYPTKPIPVALRRTGTRWTAAPITMPMNPAGCMTRVWFSKTSEAWVSSYNNGGGGHFRFDRLTGDQTYARSLSPSCVGFPSGSPILCAGQNGGGLITTDGRNGDPFEFGGAVGDGNWPSNFFVLQDDIWSYGVGILHCSKGQVCLSQRR